MNEVPPHSQSLKTVYSDHKPSTFMSLSISSLPIPPLTSHPCHLHFSTNWYPILPTLTLDRCPNHLNLPHLTTSATLCTPRRLWLYKSTLRFHPSTTHRRSISPSFVSFSPDYADLLPSSPRFKSHMSMHSRHRPCLSLSIVWKCLFSSSDIIISLKLNWKVKKLILNSFLY